MVDSDTLQRWHQWAARARVGQGHLLVGLEEEIFDAYVNSVREDLPDTEKPTGDETLVEVGIDLARGHDESAVVMMIDGELVP